MQVRLRLQRIGKSSKGTRSFRIVAISRTTGRDGRHLEIVGIYDPNKQPEILRIDLAKLDKWIGNGAQMSETVKSLVAKYRRQETAAATSEDAKTTNEA